MENIDKGRRYQIGKNNVLLEWSRNTFLLEKEKQKNSIAYNVIRLSFGVGILLSIFILINSWCFVDVENKVPNITSALRDVWNIVIPIITFALGHIFGRHSEV